MLSLQSLFTNVPVKDTIQIVIDNVYNHDKLAPPNILPNLLRDMLLTCTMEAPFITPSGQLYVQQDGCSMGSCLGPTVVDLNMCNLEDKIFESTPNLRPTIHCRYVDDIFVLTKDLDQVFELRHSLISNSILNFTYELEKFKR